MFLQIEVQSMVSDNVRVPQHFYTQKVLLQLQVVLLVHPHHLDRIDLATLDVLTCENHRVTPLSYLLENLVLAVETVDHALLFFLVFV